MTIAYQYGRLGSYQLFTPNNGAVGPRRANRGQLFPSGGRVMHEQCGPKTRTLPRVLTPMQSYTVLNYDGGVTGGGLGGLGRIGNIACGSHDDELDKLDTLLGEATRINLTGTVVEQARAYMARFEGWHLISPRPVLPATCTKETSLAQAHYRALNDAIRFAGGAPGMELVVETTPPPAEGESPSLIDRFFGGGAGGGTTSTIKTVAIAAGVIAGAVVLVPIVWEAVGWAKMYRKSKAR